MYNKSALSKSIHLTLWTLILSVLTGVLGAAPLRGLRNHVGQRAYWVILFIAVTFLGAFVWWPLALALAAQTLLVGIYSEFEEREFNLNQSICYALFLTSLIISSAFYTWAILTGKSWLEKSTQWLDTMFVRMKEMNFTLLAEVKGIDVAQNLPAAVIIFLMLSLAVALLFDRFFMRTMGTRTKRVEKLTALQVPDFLIWAFIVALLGAFSKHEIPFVKAVSINVLNVSLAAYFFQGIAVMYSYFDHFRVGSIWRFLWTLLFIVQLPMAMSLLGIVDFWADLRKSFAKKAAEIKKRRIQE